MDQWIFGLCVHQMSLGQLQRLGAITGAPPPPHNKARALMEGLVALARHTTTAVRVIVQLVSVWEAWAQPRHRGPFQDQLEHLTEQDYHRVMVLYVSRNTRSPEAPGSEPQLRRRQRDAALAAWERAKQYQDRKKTEWQRVLDEDHQLIYIPMPSAAWPKSTVTKSITSAKSQTGIRANKLSNTRSSSLPSAASPGQLPPAAGHLIEVGINVELVGLECTRG